MWAEGPCETRTDNRVTLTDRPQDNVLADLPLDLAKLRHVLELLDLSHNRLQQV